MIAQCGRIQWSKLGITVYDGDGGFVCRLEDERDKHFFNECIVQALKRISAEQVRRKQLKSAEATSNAVQVEETSESRLRGLSWKTDAGQGPRVGGGNAEHQDTPTTSDETTEEQEEVIAPI